MKTRITTLLAIACLPLCSCQNGTSGSSSPSVTTILADVSLASSVAAQYESAAKAGKVTPSQYAAIATSAANQYAASQPGANAAQIQQWVAMAAELVSVYDAAHGVK